MKRPRFELCGKRGGYFVRFIAANGREVWRTSETYVERRDALRAVRVLEWGIDAAWVDGPPIGVRDATDKAQAGKGNGDD